MIRIVSIVAFCVFLSSCREGSDADHTAGPKAEIADPLTQWNDGPTKQSIIEFVTSTTEQGNPNFIPEADRIACFDNDGTLWSEQPIYFQLAFALDRVKAMTPEHPEWKAKQPFKALLEGDLGTALAGGERAIMEIIMTTHAGMTTEEFDQTVRDWMATATHPTTGKHYNEMIYQPMVELLQYLRQNGYKTFIVSGGGVDFMRAWVDDAYGIPSDQVVGSSGKVAYQVGADGKPILMKLPELNFIDDKEGKPVGIHQYIGKRPVFTAGNSDGDYAMLQWTTTASGYPRFGLVVHHTDSVREWSYDRASSIGHLDKGLDDAVHYKWTVVDMQRDWRIIYPSDQ
jgi:phosphoglycolate phosphatase-like HAD superfamily hydrolase